MHRKDVVEKVQRISLVLEYESGALDCVGNQETEVLKEVGAGLG